MRSTCARSTGDQRPSIDSTGGGSSPGVPRTKFRNCCCAEVNNLCAAASVSAAKAFTPTIAKGSRSPGEGMKLVRYSSSAPCRKSGAKWDAKAKGP